MNEHAQEIERSVIGYLRTTPATFHEIWANMGAKASAAELDDTLLRLQTEGRVAYSVERGLFSTITQRGHSDE